jgi:hypothetical protein
MSIESRSRMISFRLSAEEYERFHDLCFTNGMRNVSEMARAAIHLLLQQPARPPQETLESRVADLESRFHFLSLELKRLSHSVFSSSSSGHSSVNLNGIS